MSAQTVKGSPKKRRVRIHETTLENDIRYRGPLSPRHFKILGWLCIVISQVAALVRLGGRFDAGFAADSAAWLETLSNVADLSLPFLLIASFSQLLNTEDGYRKQILVNAAAMAGICALYYLLFYRYLVGGFEAILDPPSDALPTVRNVLSVVTPYGFITFNIFVDLFLCALTMFFLNYNPRRVFTGGFRVVFRLLALLPIGYEVGCMVLKMNSARGMVRIPEWAFPLLTVKPPMTFVLFVALALFVKTRELRFRRHGKNHEEYQAFLKTNRNSWNFSVFLAIMLVIVSVADIAVTLGFGVSEAVHTVADVRQAMATASPGDETAATAGPVRATPMPARTRPGATQAPTEAAEGAVSQAADGNADLENVVMASVTLGTRLALAVGFGGSIPLIILAPLVLLFSYTRRPKNALLDMLIPAAGIALILFAYLEGGHQMLGMLPIKRINLQELRNELSIYMTLLMS